MTGFSKTWTDGTDSLEKHIKGDPHRKACDLLMKIGRGLSKTLEEDKEVSLRIIF